MNGIIILTTYPGPENALNWRQSTYKVVETISFIMWFTLNVGSTFIAMFAIYQLYVSVRELRKNNPNLKFNMITMTVHVSMLTIELLAMFLFGLVTLRYAGAVEINYLVNIILTAIDCVV